MCGRVHALTELEPRSTHNRPHGRGYTDVRGLRCMCAVPRAVILKFASVSRMQIFDMVQLKPKTCLGTGVDGPDLLRQLLANVRHM